MEVAAAAAHSVVAVVSEVVVWRRLQPPLPLPSVRALASVAPVASAVVVWRRRQLRLPLHSGRAPSAVQLAVAASALLRRPQPVGALPHSLTRVAPAAGASRPLLPLETPARLPLAGLLLPLRRLAVAAAVDSVPLHSRLAASVLLRSRLAASDSRPLVASVLLRSRLAAPSVAAAVEALSVAVLVAAPSVLLRNRPAVASVSSRLPVALARRRLRPQALGLSGVQQQAVAASGCSARVPRTICKARKVVTQASEGDRTGGGARMRARDRRARP